MVNEDEEVSESSEVIITVVLNTIPVRLFDMLVVVSDMVIVMMMMIVSDKSCYGELSYMVKIPNNMMPLLVELCEETTKY